MTDENIQLNAVELATELTIAWLSNSNTRTSADEVPAFLARMHSSVQSLMSGTEGTDAPATGAQDYSPAVSTRKSLANPDFIVSMVDGKSWLCCKTDAWDSLRESRGIDGRDAQTCRTSISHDELAGV